MLRTDLSRLAPVGLLAGLDEAVSLVVSAVRDQAPVLVVGDYDADGATATALMLRGLRLLGHTAVSSVVPDRFELGYGLSPELVRRLPPPLPRLLVTVDNGISSLEGVKLARELGMRVLVTDHHLPGQCLPEADAIVNPNLPGCAFPSKHLAGVGVAFYLLLAVERALHEQGWFANRSRPDMRTLLDLVALGTVADLVPLDDNNRILVSRGLSCIRQGQGSTGIQALLRVAGRDPRHCTSADLAFAVAPRLNAAGRLENMELGIQCLLADEPEQARRLANALDTVNDERKQIQQDMLEQADAIVGEIVQTQPHPPPVVVVHHARWHSGVVGLVAARLKQRLHRPVIALAPGEPGSSEWKGSARSIPGFHLRDFLAEIQCSHPGVIHRFGGHAMAAGLSLAQERLGDFARVVTAVASERMDPALLQSVILHDGVLTDEDFSLELAEQLERLLPWGQGCPPPLFDGRFQLRDHRQMAGRHLRLELVTPRGTMLEAVAFSTPAERVEGLREIRLVYALEVNRFRGRRRLQLRVEHLFPA